MGGGVLLGSAGGLCHNQHEIQLMVNYFLAFVGRQGLGQIMGCMLKVCSMMF